jgi:kynureninase
MADSKVTGLSSLATPAGEDLLMIIDDPSGSPSNRKITLGTLFGKIPANTVINGTLTANTNSIRIASARTPANSTITVAAGNVFWDADFLYVATGTNQVKRVALQSF